MTVEKLNFESVKSESLPVTIILNSVIQNIKDPTSFAVWAYLYSHSGNWKVIKEHIKNHFKIGNNKLKVIFSYLQRSQLISYERDRKSDGKVSKVDIVILNGMNFDKNEPFIAKKSTGSKIEPVVKYRESTTGSKTRRVVFQTCGSGLLLNKTKTLNKEKAQKEREALSVDNCLMTEEQKAQCLEKRRSWEEVWCKFVEYYGDVSHRTVTWKIKLQKWIDREIPAKLKKDVKTHADVTQQSTSAGYVRPETPEENQRMFEKRMRELGRAVQI